MAAPAENLTSGESVSLELDDIQSGALHERPTPYVGAYLLIRVDDRTAGRELVRRLLSVVDSGRPTAESGPGRLGHRCLHLLGVEGARCPTGLAGQLRTGVSAGDGRAGGRVGRRRRE